MPPLVVRRALVRGALYWAGVRLMLLLIGAAASAATQRPPNPLEGHAILMGAIMAMIAWADLTRRNEVTLLANLGIGVPAVTLLYMAPAGLIELALALFA